MRRLTQYCAIAGGVVALGACDLAVQNPNNPETRRVLSSPNEVESLLGSYYLRWHAGMYGALGNVWGMANVQSFENYSSLNNNLQNARAGIPRPANDNSPGNLGQGEHFRVYSRMNEVNRVASDILVRINNDTTYFLLGAQGQAARTRRAQAFAELLRGLSLGYLALTYDSSGIISPMMGTGADCDADPIIGVCRGALRGYKEVNDSAIAALTRAIGYASMPTTGSGGFPLPGTWIPSSTTFDTLQFNRLARSYRARFRADVARDPTERAAVDWNLVIADATTGITADHNNITNSSTGPFDTWVAQYETSFGLWHQMTPFIIGMADVSGTYDAWTKTGLDVRSGFHMVTPDLRFPQGNTRGEQQADFAITGTGGCDAAGLTCKRYYRNRPSGEDQLAGLGWGLSEYDYVRYYTWARRGSAAGGGQNGPMIYMTKAEMDLLAAEGYYRKSPPDYVSAANLVNITRTRGMSGGTPSVATGGGLPAVTGTVDGGPAMVGPNCIPKKPSGGYGPSASTACGDLWEALKYEKRVETQFSHFMAWFLDSRGWGDLPQGTPLYWATPYDDLLARGKPASAVWSVGGGGSNPGSAAQGTYGW